MESIYKDFTEKSKRENLEKYYTMFVEKMKSGFKMLVDGGEVLVGSFGRVLRGLWVLGGCMMFLRGSWVVLDFFFFERGVLRVIL